MEKVPTIQNKNNLPVAKPAPRAAGFGPDLGTHLRTLLPPFILIAAIVALAAYVNAGGDLTNWDNFIGGNMMLSGNLTAKNITASITNGVINAAQYESIQAAINAASASASAKTVFIPAGTYFECINIPSGVNVHGAGSGFYSPGTTLTCSNGTTITMAAVHASEVKNLRLYGTGYGNESMIGMNLTQLDKQVVFESIYIDNVHTGIILDGSYSSTFKTIRIGGTGTKMLHTGFKMLGTSGQINAPTLMDWVIGDAFGDAIYAEAMNGVYAYGLQLVHVDGTCLNITGVPAQVSGPNTLVGVAADNCGRDGIHIDKARATDSKYMQFIAPWVTHAQNGIYLNDSYSISITAPVIEFVYKNGIVFDHALANQLTGGSVYGWDQNDTGAYSGLLFLNDSQNNIVSNMDVRAVDTTVHSSINEFSGYKNHFSNVLYDRPLTLNAYSSFQGTNVTSGKGFLRLALTGTFGIVEGTNAIMGAANLTGGSLTVNTSAVTASSRIFLSTQDCTEYVGTPYVSARTAGVNFTISSTNASSTCPVAWAIIEPVS